MEKFNHILLKRNKIEINLDIKPIVNFTGDLNKDLNLYSWELNTKLIDFASGEMSKLKRFLKEMKLDFIDGLDLSFLVDIYPDFILDDEYMYFGYLKKTIE